MYLQIKYINYGILSHIDDRSFHHCHSIVHIVPHLDESDHVGDLIGATTDRMVSVLRKRSIRFKWVECIR